MATTKFCHGCQSEDDQDYPVSRAFFHENVWFRSELWRRGRDARESLSRQHVNHDEEHDALRQELAGWKSNAAYWQGRCARAEMDNQTMHRLLNERRKSQTEAAPGVFRGVQDEHVGG